MASDNSDWKKDFEKFLNDRAVKTRRSLLGISAIAWFVVLTGSVPNKISWIGITFSKGQRDGMKTNSGSRFNDC